MKRKYAESVRKELLQIISLEKKMQVNTELYIEQNDTAKLIVYISVGIKVQ